MSPLLLPFEVTLSQSIDQRLWFSNTTVQVRVFTYQLDEALSELSVLLQGLKEYPHE